ncbi:MAG: hypothetical protein HZB39_20055 [Planctomycetes bacterium]|nr:hypothetical protein [Planctomycetota bacterium]
MRKLLSLASCLLVAAPLAAQLQYSAGLVSASELRALAIGNGGGGLRTVPANTDLSAGWTLTSIASLASATTTVSFLHGGTGPTVVTIEESCTASYYPNQPASGATGPHWIRFVLRSSSPSGGRLRVSFTTDQLFGTTSGSASVDIGADGSDEFSAQPGQFLAQDYFVAIDSIGTPILIRTSAFARSAPTSRIRTTLSLRFEPATACTATSYGPGCGPSLSFGERFVGATKDVTFRITGAPPLALGVEAIGLVRANLPIPGTNCVLLTQPVVTLPLGIDSNGNGEITHPVPYDLPFTLDIQDVAVQSAGGSIVLITSDALEVVCR